jgi:hypothetical protein
MSPNPPLKDANAVLQMRGPNRMNLLPEARTMPNLTSPEVTSIEAAYEEQVRDLYKTLFVNLASAGAARNDQENVQKFTRGLELAKRARDLALNAVASVSGTQEAATRPKKKRTARQR